MGFHCEGVNVANISIDHQEHAVVVAGQTAVTQQVVYEYFKALPAPEYSMAFERALVLGCYALQLDEVGQMLDKAARDVSTARAMRS